MKELSCQGNPFTKNLPPDIESFFTDRNPKLVPTQSDFFYRAYCISMVDTLKLFDGKEIDSSERGQINEYNDLVKNSNIQKNGNVQKNGDESYMERNLHSLLCKILNPGSTFPSTINLENETSNKILPVSEFGSHTNHHYHEKCMKERKNELSHRSGVDVYQTIYNSKCNFSKINTASVKCEYYELQVLSRFEHNLCCDKDDGVNEEILLKVYLKSWSSLHEHKLTWFVHAATHILFAFSPVDKSCNVTWMASLFPRLARITFLQNGIDTFQDCEHFQIFNEVVDENNIAFLSTKDLNIDREGNVAAGLPFFREFMASLLPKLKSLNGVRITNVSIQGHWNWSLFLVFYIV